MRGTAARWLCVLAGWAAASLAMPACTDDTTDTPEELDPPDFYLTIKLATNFRPEAVDQLDVILRDTTVLLDEASGDQYDGGITWETRDGTQGPEFHLLLTGDYFQANAMEVSRDTYEIDIPFLLPDGWASAPPDDAAFSVVATASWLDADGALQEIGRGTGQLPMPPQGSNPTTIEVVCAADWAWTCRTGCEDSANQCGDRIEDCGSGTWECVDGCCVAAE